MFIFKKIKDWIQRKRILRHFKKVQFAPVPKLVMYMNPIDYDKFMDNLGKDKKSILRMYKIMKSDLVPEHQLIIDDGIEKK